MICEIAVWGACVGAFWGAVWGADGALACLRGAGDGAGAFLRD